MSISAFVWFSVGLVVGIVGSYVGASLADDRFSLRSKYASS